MVYLSSFSYVQGGGEPRKNVFECNLRLQNCGNAVVAFVLRIYREILSFRGRRIFENIPLWMDSSADLSSARRNHGTYSLIALHASWKYRYRSDYFGGMTKLVQLDIVLVFVNGLKLKIHYFTLVVKCFNPYFLLILDLIFCEKKNVLTQVTVSKKIYNLSFKSMLLNTSSFLCQIKSYTIVDILSINKIRPKY